MNNLMEIKNEIKICAKTKPVRDEPSDDKKKITFGCWVRMVGINLVTLASDLSASAGFSLIPPMMLKQGFSEHMMTITVGIGPFISMFLVHFIGHWSDNCRCKFGRRRPFIFGLSLFTLLSLVMIPYCKELGQLFTSNFIGAAVILGAGSVILDFSSQAILNPCKSLVSDMATGASQDIAFSVYSAMYSIGGCIGYLIPALHWESSIVGHLAGSQEKSVFDVLFIIFLMFVVINLLVANEKPYRKPKKNLGIPQNQVPENTDQKKVLEAAHVPDNIKIPRSNFVCDHCNFITVHEHNGRKRRTFDNFSKVIHYDNTSSNTDGSLEFTTSHRSPNSLERTSAVAIKIPGDSCGVCCCCHGKSKALMKSLSIPNRLVASTVNTAKGFWYRVKKVLMMPYVLRKLFIVDVICWMSIMTHSMFYSDFVGQAIYAGNPWGEEGGSELRLYDEGVRMGSWGLMIHCIASAVYAAFIQDRLIDKFGQRWIIIFGMFTFTLSMIGTILSPNVVVLNIWAAISGLGYAAVTSVPYNILTAYHRTKEVYFSDSSDSVRGMGEDMAILDSAYNFSQIIPSLFVGYLVQITKTAATYMIVSAVFGAISCCSLFFITYPKPEMEDGSHAQSTGVISKKKHVEMAVVSSIKNADDDGVKNISEAIL